MYLNNFVLSHTAGNLAQTNVRVKVAGQELVAGTDFIVAGNADKCYNGITATNTATPNAANCKAAGETFAPAKSIVVAGLSEEIPVD
jgi:hypothetical protein